MDSKEYHKTRELALTLISEMLSEITEHKIILDNFWGRHPNSYSVIVDGKETDIVIGWESIMYFTIEDVKQVGKDLIERIKEIEGNE